MDNRKHVLAIIGSTRANSFNLNLVKAFAKQAAHQFDVHIFEGIGNLPHFNPDLDTENPPQEIVAFRKLIEHADALLICTPEYVFSLPGSLKNAIEWCVSTTLFSQKPTGLITASASGQKAHEELQLIMGTVEAKMTKATTLLIPGIKSRFDSKGTLDQPTIKLLQAFEQAFKALLED